MQICTCFLPYLMRISDRQLVHDATDEELRHLTHDHLKVVAKFTSLNCAVCEALAPPYTKFADDPAYVDIVFLRLNADENPVAKKLMQDKIAPFFVTYCQGRLLECDTFTQEAEVRGLLDRLRQFQPVTG